ncbi:MAG: hypothetical protein M4579_003608 [Chaenotheca gracillima]|nr:MAG: hypothetical protein M4579_003608 [Chaenotheca gracillima]
MKASTFFASSAGSNSAQSAPYAKQKSRAFTMTWMRRVARRRTPSHEDNQYLVLLQPQQLPPHVIIGP